MTGVRVVMRAVRQKDNYGNREYAAGVGVTL